MTRCRRLPPRRTARLQRCRRRHRHPWPRSVRPLSTSPRRPAPMPHWRAFSTMRRMGWRHRARSRSTVSCSTWRGPELPERSSIAAMARPRRWRPLPPPRCLAGRRTRLVLFDASADPLHRAETELELWGTARDLIADVPDARPHKPEPPPAELAATFYPSDRIVVRRYPREPIAQSEPVAFLGLTSETYPANQQAIATFLPKVSPRGVIAVEGNRSADAVAQFLARSGVNLLFMQVTADYRVAVRP